MFCSFVHNYRMDDTTTHGSPDMNDWISADPLGEVLHYLRMGTIYYARCEFSAPWGLVLPAFEGTMMFHVVTSGRCRLEVEGEEALQLQPGDLALVPHGEGHRLVSEPGVVGAGLFDLPREQVSARYEVLRQGGGGAATRLICGTTRLEHPAAQRLLALLPRVIRFDHAAWPEMGWVQSTLRLVAAEAAELRPGGETIITRLADVLVIQAIRSWIARDAVAQANWLGALRDPRIGRAISLIHRDPARAWSVAALAAEVAMSRSAFSARFTERLGESPMQYVTRWRMQLALSWLRDEGATVGELALRLGYRSEAAFSRAFKRVTGVSPGAVRPLAGGHSG